MTPDSSEDVVPDKALPPDEGAASDEEILFATPEKAREMGAAILDDFRGAFEKLKDR
ncbi:MAG: hypothetical protein K2H64_02225 [Desulfovibrio sp.]|nr:hypothetical protein [Desulfovibrio sp.]